jgi:regulator of replication initiation timing
MEEEDIWEGCSHEQFAHLCASVPPSVVVPNLEEQLTAAKKTIANLRRENAKLALENRTAFRTIARSVEEEPQDEEVAVVNFGSNLQNFYELHDRHISQKVVREWAEKKVELKFSNTGTWTLFFDPHEIDRAWKILSESYLSGQLPGAGE